MEKNFLDELRWRGLLYQTAGQDLEEHLKTPGRVAYCGFDPTADSLHIGNLLPITLLMRWQRAGHRPIVLMGGGTGLIGDPSGKDAERQLKTREQVAANVAGQRRIYDRLLDTDADSAGGALVVNNLDWLADLGFLQVLREVGKHFSVNAMIQKDSVKDRLNNREQGISFTEFSYMILQAYDFYHLQRSHGCTVQLAGSDQYGNIVAGMDLIRRKLGPEGGQAFGCTAPLITRADGKKFGKSESGAIWLTEDRTSAYRFYQYWINVDDQDAVKFLKRFTFLERPEIEAIAAEHEQAAHLRPAQRALAREMTEMVHGSDTLGRVEAASQVLFGKGDLRQLDAAMLADVFSDVPSSDHGKDELAGGVSLVDLLPQTSLVSSKRQARDLLKSNAISVNGAKVAFGRALTGDDLLHGTTVLLRRGKKIWHATNWS